jgi:hypothetical protein
MRTIDTALRKKINRETAMGETENITIIEGPPPIFEETGDAWPVSVGECSRPYRAQLTRVRTFNGPALVERCYRAWKKLQPIYLEYRTTDGMKTQAPIQAARFVDTPEGHMLILWVRMDPAEVETRVRGED